MEVSREAPQAGAVVTGNQRANQRALLKWLIAHPGKHGAEIPSHFRHKLRAMEKAGLIEYSASGGWRVTAEGERKVCRIARHGGDK